MHTYQQARVIAGLSLGPAALAVGGDRVPVTNVIRHGVSRTVRTISIDRRISPEKRTKRWTADDAATKNFHPLIGRLPEDLINS